MAAMRGTLVGGAYNALDKRGSKLIAGLTNALHGII
jgi:hypothetical protein